MSTVLTVVVPLHVDAGKGESDLDRFERLLWPSFQRLWQGTDPLCWLVVCPPQHRGLMRARLDALGVQQALVVCDDELVPGLAGLKGWHKQQILKLAAARRVETSHYLTLDADVVLMRPASVEALLPDGRPLLGDRRGRDHLDWWAASAHVLRSDVRVQPDDRVMGVTPAILQTQLARRALDEVALRNGADDAVRLLFERRRERWTEYTLYWTLALETGVSATYLADGRPLYMGLFDPAHRDRLDSGWLDTEYGRPDGPFFLVVQSTFGFEIQRIVRAIRPWLDLPEARSHGRRFFAAAGRRVARLKAACAWWYRRFRARRAGIDLPRGSAQRSP
jgi:hypothetical protein